MGAYLDCLLNPICGPCCTWYCLLATTLACAHLAATDNHNGPKYTPSWLMCQGHIPNSSPISSPSLPLLLMARERAHTIWAGLSQANYDSTMGGKGCQGQGPRSSTLGQSRIFIQFFNFFGFVCLFYFFIPTDNCFAWFPKKTIALAFLKVACSQIPY